MPVALTGAATDGCAHYVGGASTRAANDARSRTTRRPRSRRGDAQHRTHTLPVLTRSSPVSSIEPSFTILHSTWAPRRDTHHALHDAARYRRARPPRAHQRASTRTCRTLHIGARACLSRARITASRRGSQQCVIPRSRERTIVPPRGNHTATNMHLKRHLARNRKHL